MALGSDGGTLTACGGVAQLGEHLLCKQGVTGSIPVVSRSVVSRSAGLPQQVLCPPEVMPPGVIAPWSYAGACGLLFGGLRKT
jgi:hypothetical protein